MKATRTSEGDPREQAVATEEEADFHSHMFIYVAVSAVLVVIWAATGTGFVWPIFRSWLGRGVAANAWDVYGRKPIDEEESRREAERLRG